MCIRPFALFSLLFGLLLLTSPLHAQSNEADISVRLIGKPLFLRGFWAEDKLKFDATGNPRGRVSTVSFTVSGIRVNAVQFQGDTLHIVGVREGLEFDEDGNMNRVTLRGRKGSKDTKDKKPEKIEMEVYGPASHDFAPALKAIFADRLADLIPSLPPFWQHYAQANFLARDDSEDDGTSASKTKVSSERDTGASHVGLMPPKATHQEDPRYSDYARRMLYSGNATVYLWIHEDGSISHLSVDKAVGLGLDEQAVASVMKYRFAPATRDGKPVKVDLYIDVNFQIF